MFFTCSGRSGDRRKIVEPALTGSHPPG
ncbi:hypothetical protein 2.34 [Burkholderia phage Bups phi1]|nr:hypothetical protein 2.34 [Burkholderia phage Bups phi1]